jgi:EmrB/QacA subfamily drug resistance transporter
MSVGDKKTAAPNRKRVLAAMCVALATVVSAVSSLNVALPEIATDLSATQTELQWIVDAYAVVFAGLLLLAGAMGDKFGRRHLLVGGLAVFAIAAAAATQTDSPNGLIVARTVMGLGAAAIMPATLSIITSVFPKGERDKAVAVWAGVAGGSALLGLLASGLLLEVFSWQSVFAFSALLAIGALVAALRVAPNSRESGTALDVTGGLISAVGLTALVYAIIEGPERGWGDAITLGAFAVAVVMLTSFVIWELRRENPLLDPRLFKLRGFGAGTASITVQFFAFFGFIFVILQYIQYVMGYSPLGAGLALAPMAIMLMRLSPKVPALVDRFGAGRVAPAGLISMAIGFVVLSQASSDSGYFLLLGGLVFLGAGAALATTPATTAIVSSLPQAKQGVASAVNDLAREVGGAIGIAVLGSALADSYHSGVAESTANLPPEAAEQVSAGLPNALAVAEKLGPGGVEIATRAESAFIDGLSVSMTIAAASVAVTALFVYWRAPREAPDQGRSKPKSSRVPAGDTA